MFDTKSGFLFASIFFMIQVFCFILRIIDVKKQRREKGLPEEEYDERQELYRGKAFQYGFYVLPLLTILNNCLAMFVREPIFEPYLVLPLVFLLCGFVIVEYEIWHDVFFSARRKSKKEKAAAVILWTFWSAILSYGTFHPKLNKYLAVKGKFDFSDLLHVCFILWCLVWLSALAYWIMKKIRDRE